MANHNNWMRRDVLKAGLSTLLAAPVAGAAGGEAVAVGLVLRETAGLRRFGFPVHALLPGDLPGRNARLLREGRPVDAQFRRVGRRALALDIAHVSPQGRRRGAASRRRNYDAFGWPAGSASWASLAARKRQGKPAETSCGFRLLGSAVARFALLQPRTQSRTAALARRVAALTAELRDPFDFEFAQHSPARRARPAHALLPCIAGRRRMVGKQLSDWIGSSRAPFGFDLRQARSSILVTGQVRLHFSRRQPCRIFSTAESDFDSRIR
jgi:hypothetical protein